MDIRKVVLIVIGAAIALWLFADVNVTTTTTNGGDQAAVGDEEVAPPPEQPAPLPVTYWNALEAQVTVQDSEWARQNDITYAECYGLGEYQLDELNEPAFERFRCVLRGPRFADERGSVWIATTGPDSFDIERTAP